MNARALLQKMDDFQVSQFFQVEDASKKNPQRHWKIKFRFDDTPVEIEYHTGAGILRLPRKEDVLYSLIMDVSVAREIELKRNENLEQNLVRLAENYKAYFGSIEVENILKLKYFVDTLPEKFYHALEQVSENFLEEDLFPDISFDDREAHLRSLVSPFLAIEKKKQGTSLFHLSANCSVFLPNFSPSNRIYYASLEKLHALVFLFEYPSRMGGFDVIVRDVMPFLSMAYPDNYVYRPARVMNLAKVYYHAKNFENELFYILQEKGFLEGYKKLLHL